MYFLNTIKMVCQKHKTIHWLWNKSSLLMDNGALDCSSVEYQAEIILKRKLKNYLDMSISIMIFANPFTLCVF